MPEDEERTTQGDRRQVPRAPRKGSALGPVGDSAAVAMGFAVMLGCRFRSPAASLAEPLEAVYPEVKCGFIGGPPRCSPIDCPIVKLAGDSLTSHLTDQALRGIGRAGLNLFQRFFRKPEENNADGER
jgi:hypothetical protein